MKKFLGLPFDGISVDGLGTFEYRDHYRRPSEAGDGGLFVLALALACISFDEQYLFQILLDNILEDGGSLIQWELPEELTCYKVSGKAGKFAFTYFENSEGERRAVISMGAIKFLYYDWQLE